MPHDPAPSSETLPFGAIRAPGQNDRVRPERPDARSADERSDARREAGPRRGRRRGRGGSGNGGPGGDGSPGAETATDERSGDGARSEGRSDGRDGRPDSNRRGARGRRRRRGRGGQGAGGPQGARRERGARPAQTQTQVQTHGECSGLLVLQKHGGTATLRQEQASWLPGRDDVFVSQRLVQRFKLGEGALVEGRWGPGQGQHRRHLLDVTRIDGRAPKDVANLPSFRKLTSIDPDFHYALGDSTEDVSLRIIDVLCPIGRGTRGLIVAPPRSGKTILLRKIAAGMTKTYPDVHLMVLLADERPEEATEWQRATSGQVFVSTNDESPERHVALAEVVWKRCMRLVELGQDVMLLMDSITRLARAYNNLHGGTGRTLSGGLDSRAMERPKQFFGSARNTEAAGSLTILGTTLIETGSRMDQVIFEEFKGTGNMELVLSRKLADRRIFPALDIERSGTRKEEKLLGMRRLKRVQTLRRVLARMNFVEAMELLITKLEDVEKTDDFLARFDVDPDA